MFCPNLSDPNIKEQFSKLENALPDYAYYLWDKYQGDVPAKYYNIPSNEVSQEVSERIMGSRTLTPEEVAKRIIQEDIKKEKVKDLIYNTLDDPNYITLTREEKKKYLSSKIFDAEILDRSMWNIYQTMKDDNFQFDEYSIEDKSMMINSILPYFEKIEEYEICQELKNQITPGNIS